MAPFSRIPVCFPWVQSRWFPHLHSLLTSQCIRDYITCILSSNLRTLWLRSYITSILQMRKLRHGKPKFLPGSLNGSTVVLGLKCTWPRVWRAELINECAQLCPTLGNPMDCGSGGIPQTPPSMGFFGQNTGTGCHFLPGIPGIFLTQGLNLCLLHWQAFFTTEPPGCSWWINEYVDPVLKPMPLVSMVLF